MVLIDIDACCGKRLQRIGADVSSDQGGYAHVGDGLSCLYPCAA
jgi:hypothetical protein